jgi:hypothetical protein
MDAGLDTCGGEVIGGGGGGGEGRRSYVDVGSHMWRGRKRIDRWCKQIMWRIIRRRRRTMWWHRGRGWIY